MTVPSLSLAVAVIVVDTPTGTDALLAGAVMPTVGGTFAAVTVTAIAADVVVAPLLSVATAVNVAEPAAAGVHVALYGLVDDVESGVPFTRN